MKAVPYTSNSGQPYICDVMHQIECLLCIRDRKYISVQLRHGALGDGQAYTQVSLENEDYMLVYHCDDLLPLGHMDSNFYLDRDFHKSTSGFVSLQVMELLVEEV